MALTNKSNRTVTTAQVKIEEILLRYGPFLPLVDAAKQAAIPLPTLSDAVRNGRIQSLRLFDKSYVRLRDVEAYIAQGKTPKSRATLAQTFADLAAGVDADIPSDLSVNMRHYLYGHDKDE